MNDGIDVKTKEKIINIINALLPEISIYLFGSRARGTQLQWSDIDIAVEAQQSITSFAIGELVSMFEASNIPYKIQIVDFNSVSHAMQENILNERIIWKK